MNKYDIEYEIDRIYPFTHGCDEYSSSWECHLESVCYYYSKFLELYKDKKLTDEKIEEYLSLPEDKIDTYQREALEKLSNFLQKESFIVNIFKKQIKEKEKQVKSLQKEIEQLKDKIKEIEEDENGDKIQIHTAVEKIPNISKFKCKETDLTEENEMLANWCADFMDKIEEIAHKKYPNVTYWCDTGSRWNVCMAMLQQFEEDLKVRK